MKYNYENLPETFTVEKNQARRPARKVAQVRDKMLAEYFMPSGTTALIEIQQDRGVTRSIAYKSLPKKYIKSMLRSGRKLYAVPQKHNLKTSDRAERANAFTIPHECLEVLAGTDIVKEHYPILEQFAKDEGNYFVPNAGEEQPTPEPEPEQPETTPEPETETTPEQPEQPEQPEIKAMTQTQTAQKEIIKDFTKQPQNGKEQTKEKNKAATLTLPNPFYYLRKLIAGIINFLFVSPVRWVVQGFANFFASIKWTGRKKSNTGQTVEVLHKHQQTGAGLNLAASNEKTPLIGIDSAAKMTVNNSIQLDGTGEQIADLIKTGFNNIWMVGPAGSGKTTIAGQIAQRFNVPLYVISCGLGTSAAEFMGYKYPSRESTPFADHFRTASIIVLDEFTALDPAVAQVANSALANGSILTTTGIVQRHPQCIIIATSNTFGTGADRLYMANNELDAATRDRFTGAIIPVDYSLKYESKYDEEVVKYVHFLRSVIKMHNFRRTASTRMIIAGDRLKNAGVKDWRERLIVDWSQTERETVKQGGAETVIV